MLPRLATGERIAACELVEGRGHLLPDLILAAGATIDRNLIIACETGQPLEKVERDTDRNYWMSAEEAVAYGMVGRIITDLKALLRLGTGYDLTAIRADGVAV